jgi:hypothetical protein
MLPAINQCKQQCARVSDDLLIAVKEVQNFNLVEAPITSCGSVT